MRPGSEPAARRTGRRDGAIANHLITSSVRPESATNSRRAAVAGSAPTPGRRLSMSELRTACSERDFAVLWSVASLRLLTARQIERLHFREGSSLTQARRARRSLQRLHDLGLLARLERRIGGMHSGSAGFIYRLAPRGRALLDLTGPEGGRRRKGKEPTLAFQDHVLGISEVCVRLHEAQRDGELELVRFEAEPACWRWFSGAAGERLVIRPDGFAIVARDDYEYLTFVELDLGTETLATIRRKAEAYGAYARSGSEQDRHGVFPKVLFLAPNAARVRAIGRTVAAFPDAAGMFLVGEIRAAVALLGGGGS